MKDRDILDGLDQMVKTVRIALKTDAKAALALLELNSFLMHTSAQNRAVLLEVLGDHGFRQVITPVDWETTKKFGIQHKTGVYVLEYPDRLIVIADGEIQSGESTAEKPFRLWYKMPCG